MICLLIYFLLCVVLQDKPHTVGDGPRHKDPMSVSPGTRIVNGNHPRSG
jgi:hypothetical protein